MGEKLYWPIETWWSKCQVNIIFILGITRDLLKYISLFKVDTMSQLLTNGYCKV